jgi:hypothetical protein
MRTIAIALWYHNWDGDWSVEMGGQFHSHISESTLDELIEYALFAIEVGLTEQDARSLSLGD